MNHKCLKKYKSSKFLADVWMFNIVVIIKAYGASAKENRKNMIKRARGKPVNDILNCGWAEIQLLNRRHRICAHNFNCLSIIDFFYQNFQFWPKFRSLIKFRFLIKFSILALILDFRPKFWFLLKISLFDKNCDFWPKFRFLTKISIFYQNFDFWPKFTERLEVMCTMCTAHMRNLILFPENWKIINIVKVQILAPSWRFLIKYVSADYSTSVEETSKTWLIVQHICAWPRLINRRCISEHNLDFFEKLSRNLVNSWL